MREIDVVNDNLRHALAAFSRIGDAGAVTPAGHLSLVYAGVPYALFNTALLTSALPSQSSGFHEGLQQAATYFGSFQSPWSLWFCEQFLADADRRRAKLLLAARGLRSLMEAPAMIAPDLAPPKRAIPRLDIRPVGDQQSRLDFSTIMATAFHVPLEMSEEVYAGERLWNGPLIGWVAYYRDRAVSTACTITSPGAIGLYAVATRPPEQGRGYAESLMRHAVAHARRKAGDLPLILQSSSAGYGLYVQMGFRNVGQYVVYISH
jgi:GNAT superfamily N-acetyltransferase